MFSAIRFVPSVVVTFTLVLPATVCHAATTRVAVASGSGVGGFSSCALPENISESSPDGELVTALVVNSGTDCSHSTFARAATGNVGIDSNLSANSSPGPRGVIASATSNVLTVDIETPEAYDGSPIPVALRISQDGSIRGTTGAGSPVSTGPSIAVLTTSAVLKGRVGFGINTQDVATGASSTIQVFHNEPDQFAQDFLPPELQTSTIMVNAFHGLTVDLNMSSREVVGANVEFESVIDAANSLTLALDGPVFVLPEGFSANSADGVIVDNRFINPVPEPSSIAVALLAIGASVVNLRRTRLSRF